MVKVTINDEEWIVTIMETTQRVIESPSGKAVVQFDACVWKYLEE